MTPPPDTVFLADHSLLLAIPAFVPAVIVAGVVIYIAMRDRKSDGEGTHSDNSGSPHQDGTP